MRGFILCSAICLFSFVSISANAANVEETIKTSVAGGALCKSYADELGYDSKKFADVNVLTTQLAEKLGYTKDFYQYQAEINGIKSVLNQEMKKKYGSIDKAYKDWCFRFYDSLQKSIMANR
ncbi:hypothetical protein [Glaciecola sp. 33A]|uniref:hypothetical protein n=1 Tax=Glaciecola sp. 33A TaxID=2057807 RepID=UPI000C3267E4|nr:hypothetical protein [Glaciecola sp. 33A]PKI00276.1 hypothetical protein CXF81_19205 [Glaciecola sp. 33A]